MKQTSTKETKGTYKWVGNVILHELCKLIKTCQCCQMVYPQTIICSKDKTDTILCDFEIHTVYPFPARGPNAF